MKFDMLIKNIKKCNFVVKFLKFIFNKKYNNKMKNFSLNYFVY